jgi:hypothetical protein
LEKIAHHLCTVSSMINMFHCSMDSLGASGSFDFVSGLRVIDWREEFVLSCSQFDLICPRMIFGANRQMTRLAFRAFAAFAITLVTTAMQIELNCFSRYH